MADADSLAIIEGRAYGRQDLYAAIDRLHRRLVKIEALWASHRGTRRHLCQKLVNEAAKEFEDRRDEPVESYIKGYVVSVS